MKKIFKTTEGEPDSEFAKDGEPAKSGIHRKRLELRRKYSKDNILRKIRVIFQKFSIKFFNEIIRLSCNDIQPLKFRSLSGKIIGDLSIRGTKPYLKKPIKDFFFRNPSEKYKDNPKDYNLKLYNSLKEKGKIVLTRVLETEFSEFYEEVFLKNNNIFGRKYSIAFERAKKLEKNLKSKIKDSTYIEKFETISRNFINFYEGKGRESKSKKKESDTENNLKLGSCLTPNN